MSTLVSFSVISVFELLTTKFYIDLEGPYLNDLL